MGDTAVTVTMVIGGAAVFAYGVLLMIFAVTDKGFAKKLEPKNRARLGCSAFMTMLMGIGLISFGFTE
ncbi:MAG: hypothetical protein K2J80_13810 [Oscillospiraceae bacterium]|nr:hypothetical protein [Oscillospiraceae bacterium]